MSKLSFMYGTVQSGKSLEIIKVAHNYQEQGWRVTVLIPEIDTRSAGTVTSRVGVSIPATIIPTGANISMDDNDFICLSKTVIIVDEAQFLSPEQVDQLALLTTQGVKVMAFGLKVDAFNHLFPGSQRLLELADAIEESRTICRYCGKKAVTQIRFDNGEPVFSGEQVQVGDSEYTPACLTCYYTKKFEKELK